MNDRAPINKNYIIDVLESILSQIGYFYEASKSNQIMIKKYLHSMPFFFMSKEHQNMLYKIIKSHQISSYIDSKDGMMDLCYFIYKDFCVKCNAQYKSKEVFYKDLVLNLHRTTVEKKQYFKRTYHNLIFYMVILCIMMIYVYMSRQCSDN
jgi:hypothetical protein